MLQNNSAAAIKELTKKSLWTNRGRSAMVICAVILTTVLFATVFSVGGGVLNQARQVETRQSGLAHATVGNLTSDQYHALAASNKKKDSALLMVVDNARNDALRKTAAEICYGEEKAAKNRNAYPTTGHMPKNTDEAAASTLVLDALGVPRELGQAVTLGYTVNGEIKEKTFRLCGFWEGSRISKVQDIWVSQAFAEGVLQKQASYSADVDFSSTWDLNGQLDALLLDAGLADASGTVNPAYESMVSLENLDMATALGAGLLLSILLLSGYLIIYNLFAISVARDIQFYGLLRTIGASGKQIKGLVRRQAMRLAAVGIPLGLLFGYGLGRVLLPFVLTQINMGDSGVYRIHPAILVGAALFAFLTVYLSSLRPCAVAAKVSPMEAVRYDGESTAVSKKAKRSGGCSAFSMAMENLKRGRKKVFLVVLSLSMSMLLLNTTYTAVHGFDLDAFVRDVAVADFYAADFSIQSDLVQEKNLTGISEAFLEGVSVLPGLENSGNLYARTFRHTAPKEMVERVNALTAGRQTALDRQFAADGQSTFTAYGVDTSLNPQIQLTQGAFDAAQWASGRYVILNDLYYEGLLGGGDTSPFYRPGDTLALEDTAGKTHTYTVMAIGRIAAALDMQQSYDYGLTALLPAVEYQSLYGGTRPMCTIFNVEDAHKAEAEKWIARYTAGAEPDLTYISRQTYQKEFVKDRQTYLLVGGALSLVLALIGILNFINAVLTSILSRRKELAMLDAVGMDAKQMNAMLVWESLAYIALAFFVTATLGTVVTYGLCTGLLSNIWVFTYHFTLTPVLLSLPFLCSAAVLVPLAFYRNMCKKSIVERLWHAE